ncbi:glutamate ligase domain-containing protein [Nocardia rhamnosiphila]|uniref:glutamate ligase domain-containing protein n=1 Tax=Nocardia rhamnosiphila TaxID=426716 RepID=UPI0009DDB0D6|nr:cyanophycin synthetase [Nocardia rhamnosiphila]
MIIAARRCSTGRRVHNGSFCVNASPESVRAVLRSLATIAADGRSSIAVLGEMRELGDMAAALHADIGCYTADLGIGTLIAVGGSHAEAMAAAAREAGTTRVA